MRRSVVPELLDSDLGSSAEVQDSLADLRAINRRFGGISTLLRLIREVAGRDASTALSLLDVAGASGDVPRSAQQQLVDSGVTLDVTLLDRAPTHLSPQFPAVAADALHMPFADDSFDMVSCSLFIHHLEPDEIVPFVDEALRVARRAVLLNDLRRSTLHLALVRAASPLFRSRLTKHDAPVSVRRAYTPAELTTMLRRTTAADVSIRNTYFFRMGAIAWKHPHNGVGR